MSFTADSARAVFDRVAPTDPPAHTTVLFNRPCALGASIAGLPAARVLADHAPRDQRAIYPLSDQ
jgi:hypothetical protein